MAETDVARVVEVFERVGAGWALVGAHAVGLLTEPRATEDFDFIVEESKLRLVVEGLRDVFGELDEEDVGAAIRLRALNVDLIRSTNHPLFGEAIAQTHKVGDWNIPSAEIVVVLKYLSAVSPWRHIDRRAQDIVDLRRVYRQVGRDNLDVARMIALAALAYPGAENEFQRILDLIDRGKPIEV
jgi:hypothetical protein